MSDVPIQSYLLLCYNKQSQGEVILCTVEVLFVPTNSGMTVMLYVT